MSESVPVKTCFLIISCGNSVKDHSDKPISLLKAAELIVEEVPREDLVAFVQHITKRAAELSQSKK